MAISKRAEKALRKSIKSWEVTAKEKNPRGRGIEDCALCTFYIDNDCKSCPIFRHTGKVGCRDTPYDAYCAAAEGEDSRVAARTEVRFLKRVLQSSLPSKKKENS